MHRIFTTSRFDRDLKRAARRKKDLSKLKGVMQALAAGENLPARNRDHPLIGNYIGRRECHIEPDWLLIYKLNEKAGEIIFERTGTHADLFK